MLRVCTSLLTVMASCTLAQEVLFLEPVDATVEMGDEVPFSLVTESNTLAWQAERIEHFFARTAWTQENRDTLAARRVASPFHAPHAPDLKNSEVSSPQNAETVAVWPADKPGILMLGCDFSSRLETVDAVSFRAFVERVLPASRIAGLGPIPTEGKVTIRRLESVKALVSVEDDDTPPASIATSKTGQAVEIRALFDPTTLTIGSDLAIKIYAALPGPAEGVVLATNTTTGEVMRALTNDSATAVLTIANAGRWRLEFHAVSSIDDDEAAWEVHTATMTFDIADTDFNTTDGEVAK